MMTFSLVGENITIINGNKFSDVMDPLVNRGFRTDKLIFPEDYSPIRKLIKNGAPLGILTLGVRLGFS